MDYNGGAPLVPAARAAMLPFLDARHGNPSSGHWAAEDAREAIDTARASVAALIGAAPSEIVFTSGATEANNLALKGAWAAARRRAGHIITSAVEHDAVLRPVRHLRTQGARTTVVRVDRNGRVDPDQVRAELRPDTVLVSVMLANNEVGTLQPIAEIARPAHEAGALMHCDAAQGVGKVPVDVGALGVDLLSLTGHKFGGPNGIGALYVREGVRLVSLLHGAGHEGGRRAGTESAMLAAGIGAAAAYAAGKDHAPVRRLRDRLWQRLRETFGARVVLNGDLALSVPNTLSVSFPGEVGAEILARVPEVAATTGSACHAGCIDMSHVLIAMGASVDTGLGTIRFSLGEDNTEVEVERVVARLADVLD